MVFGREEVLNKGIVVIAISTVIVIDCSSLQHKKKGKMQLKSTSLSSLLKGK